MKQIEDWGRSDYNSSSNKFWGFHGTTFENCLEIDKKKEFKFEKRNDHWLGNGVYFFIRDPKKAEWWSEMTVNKINRNYKKYHQTKPPEIKKAVICCVINVKNEKLLDLDTKTGKNKLRSFVKDLEKSKGSFSLGFSNKHQLMCFVLDFMVREFKYDAIRYTFRDENDPINTMEFGIEGHSQQLSVFNQDVIDFSSLEVKIFND